MMQKLNLTVGPVQPFIASARKTVDFWSGSFLLSYLMGKGINFIENNNGRIIGPDVSKDNLYQYIKKNQKTLPNIGSIPHVVYAELPTEINSFDLAKNTKEAIMKEFKSIGDYIYNRFIAPYEEFSNGSKVIWDRQMNNFWEIQWILFEEDENEEGTSSKISLNNIKYTRNYFPESEPGDKCMMMGEWQELSGFNRITDRKKQDDFWNKVRGNIDSNYLRENEKLCAIALIKRLFPLIVKDYFDSQEVFSKWPSTAFISAIPWLIKLAQVNKNNQEAMNLISEYVSLLEKNADKHLFTIDHYNQIPSLQGIDNDSSKLIDFMRIDSELYYIDEFEKPKTLPLRDGISNPAIKALKDKLNEIYGKYSIPSRFYSVLLMDGDKLGNIVKDKGMDTVSTILSNFTTSVNDIINSHNGFLVYAGGDDVLALLPINTVIACAVEVSQTYKEVMQKELEIDCTMSAGIVFSTYNYPLRNTLKEAHFLLDDIAKDENGRDSIAMSLIKGYEKTAMWYGKWNNLIIDNKNLLQQLIEKFEEESNFSSSFFYKSKELFGKLMNEKKLVPGDRIPLVNLGLTQEVISKLLLSEYLNTLPDKERDLDDINSQEVINSLLKLMIFSDKDKSNDDYLLLDIVNFIKFFSDNK